MRIIVLPVILAACLVGQSTERSTAASFIIRVSEARTTLPSVVGANNYSCLIVMPNGRLQFQLRSNEPFDESADVTTYESTLPSKELEKLRTIVDDAEVRALPPFGGPVDVSKDVDEWQVFDAEIMRGKRVQHVGYVTWKPEPDNLSWNRARITLRPLVDWSDSVQSGRSTDWMRVTNSTSLCGQ